MITQIKNIRNPLLLFKAPITLKPGINLLGGGNGVGKTTLLREIKQWALSMGYWKSEDRFADLFSSEEQVKATAAKRLNIQVDSDGNTGRCLFWQNATDNHRYLKVDFFNPDLRKISQHYDAGERSEGENVVVSFLGWLDELQLQATDILLVDEIDSGLSVDACNGVIAAMLSVAKKTGCQVIVTCNAFHFPYVCGGLINLLDGSPVCFESSYTKFCDFSYANARNLLPIRERAREKERKAQLAANKKEEKRRQREREARQSPFHHRRHRAPLVSKKEVEPEESTEVVSVDNVKRANALMNAGVTTRRELTYKKEW